MSFDPFGQPPDTPPPSPPTPPAQGSPQDWHVQHPADHAPPSQRSPEYPGYHQGYELQHQQQAARERVQLPAIFLIAIGALNLLSSLGGFTIGVIYANIPPEAIKEALQKNPGQAAQLKQLEGMGWTVEDMLRLYVYGGFGGGAIVALISLITIFGGARMLMLKNYGLAIFASVLAAVPCISPMSCPCLLGLVVGCWSLVVLLGDQARAGFR